jgi:hypothetical protein
MRVVWVEEQTTRRRRGGRLETVVEAARWIRVTDPARAAVPAATLPRRGHDRRDVENCGFKWSHPPSLSNR